MTISVVIVSFNTAPHLARTLDALGAAADGVALETIVVDNASTDGTPTMLAGKFPGVRTVLNGENVGFARACNAGAALAAGRAVLFLNSDCELGPGALPAMLRALDAAPDVGAVLPRLSNGDGTLQPSVHASFPGPWSLLGEMGFLSSLRYAVYRRPTLARWLLRGERRRHATTHDVAWGGAACLLVRRDVFNAIGGFDERFFMYWEDVDFAKRLREAGWRLRFVAGASAVHRWGASAAHRPPAAVIAPFVSRLRYFAKHFPDGGGAVAYRLLAADLAVRRLAFGALALLPSDRGWARERARGTAVAARAVRTDAGALGVARWETGGLGWFVVLVTAWSLFRYGHALANVLVDGRFADFAHYYTYTTAVARGISPFDAQAIAAIDAELGLRRAGGPGNYPPLFYLLFRPWAALPFPLSATLWFGLCQVALVTALALAPRSRPVDPVRVAVLAFLVLNYQPLLEDVSLGQANLPLLLLVTLAWRAARAGRGWLAAASLALAVQVKPQYGLLVPMLWVAGDRRVAWRAVAFVGAGIGVALAVLGSKPHLEYTRYVLDLPSYLHAWPANVSVRAVLLRLTGDDAPGRVLALCVAAAIVVLIAWVIARREGDADPWRWGLVMTTILLVSPLTEEHHLVLLFFPFAALLLSDASSAGGRGEALVVLVAALLVGSRYSFLRFPAFHADLPSLVLAGKTAGIALLVLVLARRVRPRAASAPA